ncbi:MAG: TonB-dependent receptor [Acidobacteria bacterium]|nr:TonB-dependent receptor [Acidobacteriota bacterium]
MTRFLFPFSLLLPIVMFSQDPRGSIVGRVSDATGAVIPDIEIRATNAATGVVANNKTTTAGTFHITYLLPGFYTLSVESTGFKKFVREGIQVRVSESTQLEIVLELGAVTETVKVVAEAPVMATTDAIQGTVIEDRAIVELPLLGGNPVEFALLDPAVMNETDMRERRAAFTNAGSQWSSMGAGSFRNEFQIDGVSNTYAEGNGRARVAFNPPPSAIGQFKIITNPFDAAAGNSTGATLNVSTKAGTNALHGEGHYYNRNAALDTMDFFYNKRNTRKPVYGDHRFGASLGGPIKIPRLYNGRNRSFFFYAWDMSLWGSPQSYTNTVPTAAQRTGDFSGLLDLGANFQVWDPFSTRPAPNNRFERDPFPGNIIPKSQFDTVGVNLANLYPLPNQPGNRDGTSNYFRATAADERYWVHLLRLDHAFSESHRVFLRLNYDFWEERKNQRYEKPIDGIVLNRINRGIAFDDVMLLTPNLVLNFRYGLTQQDFTEYRITRGIDLTSLGFSTGLTKLIRPERAVLPRVAVGAYTGFSAIESGDGANNSLTHNFNGTLSTQRGIHSLRWGGDFRTYRSFGNRYPWEASPDLSFGTNYTRGPLDTSGASAIGQDLASMLLGIATSGLMENRASFAIQTLYLGAFLQDDIKLRPRLTLNVGMRYELEWPMTERFDRVVTGFDSAATSPIEAQARINYARAPIAEIPADQFRVRGGLLFAGQTETGRSSFRMDKNNFMPRIGLAWQLSRRTTIRTGYGVFYGSLGVNSVNPLQYGFSQSTPIIPTLDNGQTYIARASNPFPNGLIAPAGKAGGFSTYLGQAIAFDSNLSRQAYSQRWTFAVQQVLPTQTMVETAYVGSRGTHALITRDINATPLEYLSTSPTRDATTISYLGQTFTNPFRGLGSLFTANTMSRANLLRPYPQFTGVTMDTSDGYSWYHSLQVRAARRWSRGVTLNAGYAFTKMMEATSFLTAGEPMPYETLSASHRPHRLTFNAIWELPFGRGRAWGKKLNWFMQGAVGNWQLSAVIIRQAGGPLTWGNIIFTGDPDQIALPKAERDVDRWFNIDAGFNRTANQALASNIRYFPFRLAGVQADGQARWDLSLAKGFRIQERVLFRLRAQCFNMMNHPNFGGPQLNPTNAAFGQITGTQSIGRSFQLAGTLSF